MTELILNANVKIYKLDDGVKIEFFDVEKDKMMAVSTLFNPKKSDILDNIRAVFNHGSEL